MAKSSVGVQFNQSWFNRIMKGSGVRALVDQRAKAVQAAAQASAPVDTGAYRRGIVVQSHDTQYRHVARVVGTDPKTMIIESKTGNLARSIKGGRR